MLTGLLLLGIESQTGTGSPVTDVFLNYGAIGAILLVFIAATYMLFNRLTAAHQSQIDRITAAHEKELARVEAAYAKEAARGDRLEKELADLNKVVNTSTAGVLARATDAIREALGIMHNQRRQ